MQSYRLYIYDMEWLLCEKENLRTKMTDFI